MATDTTKLVIELQTILRGLSQTLRGLDQIKKKLDSVASVKLSQQSSAGIDRAAAATQRLANQQQRLAIQSQELANRQERARQGTERLALSQQRLTDTEQRVARTAQLQADAHVKAFRAIQKGSDDADAHVRAFRANEAALAKAPQLDAHVRAFRATEAAVKAANDRLSGLGNSLRSIGQGLASVGATLSAVLTVPLVAVGVASVNAAVQLDSLKRGLTAIVGSADEANRQLARLTQIAKLPGIGFEEAIQGSIRLQAVGFSAREAERDLREFSNAVALTGGGRDELARVTVQLGQLAAKGKVLSQDLRPIIEAAPAVGRALLQAFGTVNAADIQELGLSSKEFLNTLVDELEKLPRAAAGAKNSFENFRDEIFRASAAVGEALLPSLIRLAEVVGPVITKLAEVFAGLPQPVQLVVIGVGALLAGLGPLLFIVGQVTLGVGRLLVGFVELNAAGILPTIASLRALTTATIGAAAAQRTLGLSSIALGGAIGGIAAIIGTLLPLYLLYNAFQKDSATLSKERADALTGEIDQLKEQAKFLDSLKAGVRQTGDEQDRLLEIYENLNRTAKVRITGIKDEEQRLAALREEIARIIALREQERIQQAATVTAELANNLLKVKANQDERDSIAGRIQSNNELIETLEREQTISADTTRALAERSITAATVENAIGALRTESENLSRSQDELIASGKELKDLTKDEVEIVRALERQTGLTARQLLIAAKNSGTFRGDIAAIIPVLESYVQKTDDATKATDRLNASLSENARKLNEAGDRADQAAKARQTIISSAAAIARETSVNFEGALKSLRQMVDAVPELAAALKRESELTGKTLNELLHDTLESAFKGRAKDKSGASLRSAQEDLAKALAAVALASSDEQVRIEKQKNEQLIQAAEVGQKLQLLSYREFLELRASLTAASVSREITQQADVVKAAKTAQLRLIAASNVAGIPAAERTKRQAQAAKANEEAIKAEAKLNELVGKRDQIEAELQQSLKLARQQQINDVRDLDIEFAGLQGHVEDALNAQTAERFKEQLKDLSLTQAQLNSQLEEAKKIKDADRVAQLESAQRLNQSQIDVIELITQQQDALAGLAAANELVRQARLKQQQLEDDLAFQVQFRGLAEEDAIKQRLAGEEKLNDSLTLAHETIRQIVEASRARGVEPPRALLEFLAEIQAAVKGLGELSFSEQFRLAQKEFDRLNDERLRKIADIERAVRERDIAEAEGLLLIRRINGEYSADLEQQLVLLRQIAAQSNDAALMRQTQSAEETVKDATAQLADFDRQLRSASIDALQEGFTNFFASLSDRTKTAKEKLLDLINSVAARIEQVIAENLSKQLIESLFGGEGAGGGILASIGRLLGLGGGGQGAAGGIGAVAGSATQATATATALTTGATAAGAALTAAGVTTGATLVTSMTAAAASFSASIIAAGAAFAATVAAAGAASGVGRAIGGLGGAIGAATGLFPAIEGGAVHIVEGGFPEAVLTTDPRHAARQLQILKSFLRETRGLGGRIRGLAMGGFTDRIDISAPSVSLANAGIGDLAVAGAPSTMRLRQVLVDQRDWRNEINSPEGEQVLVDFLYKKQHVIRKLSSKQ